MPIFNAKVSKLLGANEDKTRVIAVEFPPDMGPKELLDRISEISDVLKEEVQNEKKKQEEKTVPHSTQTEIIDIEEGKN